MKQQRQESIRDGINAIGQQGISQTEPVLFGPFVPWLIAESQQREIGTLFEAELAKLRLVFAPAEADTTRRSTSDRRGT